MNFTITKIKILQTMYLFLYFLSIFSMHISTKIYIYDLSLALNIVSVFTIFILK